MHVPTLKEEGSESFLMVSACMSSKEALADWAWLESDLLPKMQVNCQKRNFYLIKLIFHFESFRELMNNENVPGL